MIDVRKSARCIVEQARFVHIDAANVSAVAAQISMGKFARPTPEDTNPFHATSVEQAAMWCFILDSVNFCFWSDTERERWFVEDAHQEFHDGYWALVAALRRAAGEIPLFDPAWFSTMTLGRVRHLFRGQGEIPLIEKRKEALRELGQGFLKSKKSAWELVREADGGIVEFIDQILERFPLYRDEAMYHGRRIGIYKRAQILCQDLALTLSAYHIRPFKNLGVLTAFADYKLPQLLRCDGVLRYDPSLALRVDKKQQLRSGSPEEIEIRGATILAVEEIRRELDLVGQRMTSADVDNILWTEAVRRGTAMNPHHRTRTTNY